MCRGARRLSYNEWVMSAPPRGPALAAALLLATLSSAALAQSSDDPEALFAQGRRLAVAGKCAQALPLFRQSHAASPAVGTLLNIAACEVEVGRTGSAKVALEQAKALADELGDAARGRYARKQLEALQPKLSRLRVVVRSAAEGLRLSLDGEPLPAAQWGRALALDPGRHQVVARADGYHDYEAEVVLEDPGTTLQLEVPALTSSTAPPPPAAIVIRREGGLGEAPRIAGWTVGGVGLAALGVGAGLMLRAHLIVDEAEPYCPDGPNACLPEGVELRSEAQTNERAGIALLAVGGAALATGAVLLGLGYANEAPDDDILDRMAITPWVAPRVGGLILTGSF